MTTRTRNGWSLGQQIFVGCLLAGIVVAVIEASSTYDERCGWSLFGDHLSITISSDDDNRFEIREGRCRLKVEVEGEMSFTDDESGVEHLGPGAHLSIDERDRKGRRRLEVRPADGRPSYTWTVDGDEQAFDDAGRVWLRDVLPQIFRLTGIDADRRVGRLLRRHGVEGVLDEVEHVRGDRLQRRYLDELLNQATPTVDELASTLKTAGNVIGTDRELRPWLSRISAAQLSTPEARQAYRRAMGSIGTDREMRLALSALLHSDGLEPETLEMLLDAANGIGTDHEMAELLIDVASTWPQDQALPEELADAIATIGTDSKQRRVLAAAFERPGISDAEVDFLLRTAPQISTDHELAGLLTAFANTYPPDRDLTEAFFAAVATLGTDGEQRRVLSAVVARSELSASTIEAVLDSALAISTDHELAGLLTELAAAHPIEAQLEPALARALATLGTNERQRVEQAFGHVEQVHG